MQLEVSVMYGYLSIGDKTNLRVSEFGDALVRALAGPIPIKIS